MADHNHKYQQLADVLRGQIESGRIRSGEQLPTELELREEHNASRNTVRDALQLLIMQGHVESKKGQGWFAKRRQGGPVPITVVVDQKDGLVGIEGSAERAAIGRQGRHLSDPRMNVAVHPASPETARQLRIPPGSSVITRSEQLWVDGQPWSVRSTAYPRELAGRAPDLLIAEDISDGAIAYIERVSDISEVGHDDLITSREANAEEAAFFQAPEGIRVPVTVVTRIGYQAAALRPLRVTTVVYPVGHVNFAVSSGLVPHGQHAASEPSPGIDFG